MNRSARIFLAFLAIIALACVVFGAWRGYLHWRVASLEAELRAAGNPLSIAELEAMLGVADAPTGATPLGEAYTRLQALDGVLDRPSPRRIPFVQTGDFDPGDQLSKQELPPIENLLSTCRPAMESVIAALDRQGENPVLGADENWRTLEQFREKVYVASQLYALDTVYRAQTGDIERAVASAIILRRLDTFLERQPQYLMQTYRDVLRTQAYHGVNHLLTLAELNPAQLDALAAVWTEADEGARLLRSWQTKFCTTSRLWPEDLVNAMSSASPRVFPILNTNDTPAERWRELVYKPRLETYWLHQPGDRRMYLTLYRSLAAMRGQPPDAWKDAFEKAYVPGVDAPMGYYLTRVAKSEITVRLRSVQMDVVRTRIIAIAIAAERYRLDHGTFPKSGDALVPAYLPEIPADLFGDGPLQYRRDGGTGYMIVAEPFSQYANPTRFVVQRRAAP